LDNVRGDHEAGMRLEASRQRELTDKLAKRDKELHSLLNMHKKMCDEVKALT